MLGAEGHSEARRRDVDDRRFVGSTAAGLEADRRQGYSASNIQRFGDGHLLAVDPLFVLSTARRRSVLRCLDGSLFVFSSMSDRQPRDALLACKAIWCSLFSSVVYSLCR